MNPNTEYERFTQRIYQKLVNNDVLKPTTVQHNVKLKGKSGCEHQIDVYWEYEIAGNMHRVAIECKNYNSLVPIGKVRDFYGVLSDLNNVNGIMVSKRGYQEGAKKYAQEHGISLKELREPDLNEPFGAITITTYVNARHCLFLIDENWANENCVSVEGLRQFLMSFQREKADYWKSATHFPIEKKDDFIRNSKGEKISSIEELEEQLPDNPKSGSSIIFAFEDGWINTRYWGLTKIREVKFEYESDTQEVTFNLAADAFVDAILQDALEGETSYVPKY